MSHIRESKALIPNTEAALQTLAAAALKFGLELRRNQQQFRGWRTGTCLHALGLPNKPEHYEVGLVAAREDKTMLKLAADYTAGTGFELQRLIGLDGDKLMAEFGALTTEQQLQLEGYATQRTVLEDGSVRIHAVAA